MVPERNELLSALPASEREALGVHLRRTLLPRDSVLHETGETIKTVYFPESGAISLAVDLRTGEVIEGALVGSDGGVGGFAAVKGWPALNKAIVQIESSVLAVSAEQLRRLCATAPRCPAARSAQSILARAGAAICGLPCVAPSGSPAVPLAASRE